MKKPKKALLFYMSLSSLPFGGMEEGLCVE